MTDNDMTSHDAGAAQPRHRATDLDAADPGRRSLKLRPSKAQRFALHLLSGRVTGFDSVQQMLESSPKNPPREVSQARSATGLHATDASAFLNPSRWMGQVPPRGVPWTDYPILAMPAYEMRLQSMIPVHCPGRETPTFCYPDDLPECVDLVLVHLPRDTWNPGQRFSWGTIEWLSKAQALISALKPGIEVVLVAGTEVVGGLQHLSSLTTLGDPLLRFRYSYEANFRAIAGKALEHALALPDPNALALHQALFPANWRKDHELASHIREKARQRRMAAGLQHPFALQVLFGLRRRGKVALTCAAVDWREGNRAWQTDLVYLGAEDGLWHGTGKYEPVRFPDALVTDIAHEIAYMMLVCQDGSELRLSPTGQAFLDALHPDSSDPDLPMRWEAWPLADGDRESMDTWIGRVFRKMKKGVAPP